MMDDDCALSYRSFVAIFLWCLIKLLVVNWSSRTDMIYGLLLKGLNARLSISLINTIKFLITSRSLC